MNKNNCVLKIENLFFGYSKEKLIYKDFNLTLKKAELKSIIGESGSGKSTLFELISNNLEPIKGKIVSSKIASIFQDPYSSFHPSYTIIEQIKDVLDLKELDFDEKLNKFCIELSLEKELLNKKTS